jgi:adenylosuccinate synthase
MEKFRLKGREFGATTGRARRCGWFDSVLVRYALVINGISELAIMKLDILDGMKKIKICTAYQYRGKTLTDFPLDFEVLSRARPVYEEVDGWDEPCRGMEDFSRLPRNAKAYIKRLEDLLKVRIRYISTGSKRNETIVRGRG